MAESSLGDELLRAVRMFEATLDADDIVRIPFEPAASPLVRRYTDLAAHLAESTGIDYFSTCSPLAPGICLYGVIADPSFIGYEYEYGTLPMGDSWERSFAGEPSVSPVFADDFGEWINASVPIRNRAGQVVAIATAVMEASHLKTMKQQVFRQVAWLGVILVALWLIVAFIIARTIVRPVAGALSQFSALVQQVAQGDLTIERLPVRTSDEIGQLSRAFNEMVARLRQLLRNVADSVGVVLQAANELTSASEQSAKGAREAAEVIAQVAAAATNQSTVSDEVRQTMRQLQEAIAQIAAGAERSAGEVKEAAELLNAMSADIGGVTQHALQEAKGVQQVADNARDGRDTMQRAVAAMDRIRDAVTNTAEQMRELATLSAQIGEINNLISDIAEQTNLLALNAAIEAARAGEHGRGFAVVADEVRSLAERSAASANEIAELIRNVQSRTTAAVQAMESGLQEVADGVRLADDADRALEGILQLAENAATGMGQIATAAEEMNYSAKQVVEAFDEMATVTEQNTAATEQMAASATTVDQNVLQLTTLAQENAAAAEEVSASVEELTASATQVSQAAESLGRIAQELQTQVTRFRL